MVIKIKFRIWNRRGKRMLYDSSLAIKGNQIIEESGFPVMQFTNLLDKNKKEIYDGDILKYFIGGKEYFMELYQISFSEERACWQINIIRKCNHINSPQFYSSHLTQTYASCFEVVGNIYEHKEFLSVSPTSQTKSSNEDFPNGEHNISLKENSKEFSQISANAETSPNPNIIPNSCGELQVLSNSNFKHCSTKYNNFTETIHLNSMFS